MGSRLSIKCKKRGVESILSFERDVDDAGRPLLKPTPKSLGPTGNPAASGAAKQGAASLSRSLFPTGAGLPHQQPPSAGKAALAKNLPLALIEPSLEPPPSPPELQLPRDRPGLVRGSSSESLARTGSDTSIVC